MNSSVLLVGAGRRVSFASRWVERGYAVHAYEGSANVPIALVANVIVGKPWEEAKEHLASVVSDLRPSLVLFLMDEATRLGAELRDRFPQMVVSPLAATTACLDKRVFERHMLSTYPHLYPMAVSSDSTRWPIIAKPRFGFGSRDIHVIRERGMLEKLFGEHPDRYVLQHYVQGTEYTVDAYFDLRSELVDCIPRVRERVADGEVISSRVEANRKLHELTALIGHSLGLVGPACLQFVYDGSNHYVFEANARFGGGSVLSIAAGFDVLGLIERDWLGKPCGYVPGTWNPRMAMHRYHSEYFYEH